MNEGEQRREKKKGRTVLVCPGGSQTSMTRCKYMLHQGAIIFIEGDDECRDHGNEKGLVSHALFPPRYPLDGAVDGANLFRSVCRSEGFPQALRSEYGGDERSGDYDAYEEGEVMMVLCAVVMLHHPSISVVNVGLCGASRSGEVEWKGGSVEDVLH